MLQALIEGAPDFLTLIDRDRVVRYVSPAVTRVTGYESNDLLGKSFGDLVHPDDLAGAHRVFEEALRSRDVLTAQTRFRHKDGRWITLESLGRAHLDFPECEGVLVSSRDITQHVRLEAMLRKSEQESAELFENAPCGYHSVDANDIFRRVNRTELRWLRRTREELVGRKTFAELLAPESRPSYLESFARLEEWGVVRDAELEIVRSDGTTFPALLQSVAVCDADGALLESRTTLYDITERKTAESALRKVNRALFILSEARKKIIRARTEAELLEEICRIIVEHGGYRVAAVLFAQKDTESTMRLVAKAGDDRGTLETARLTWGNDERGRGPTGRAVRSGTAQVNKDFLTEPTVAPWRDLAHSSGARSSVSLPLKGGAEIFGVLNVYAAEADAFDAEELGLLEDLANDVSFAIGSLLAERFATERGGLEQGGARVPATAALAGLSPREREVLKWVAEGYTSKQIAAALGIAPASVDTYRSRLMFKLNAKGVSGLVRFAIRAGLVAA